MTSTAAALGARTDVRQPTIIGRYALFSEIAAGGMATVHLGRLLGQVGFARTVAIKRLHPHLAKDPEFVSMFLDEARVAARIRHPNVVPTIDVVSESDELFLVMEYVQGESLARLQRAARTSRERIPPAIVASVMVDVLHGLHAAHEAKTERGQPLDIVHRDVSPQNVLVGTDGTARVFDFGIAKAVGRAQITRDGELKGKFAYMAPEQIQQGGKVTRRSDVYAASVVMWEALTGTRLFRGDGDGEVLNAVLSAPVPPPSQVASGLGTLYDDLVMRGLERDPAARFATAREMAVALERVGTLATASEIGAYVERVAHDVLEKRAELIADIESSSRVGPHPLPDKAPPTSGLTAVPVASIDAERPPRRRWVVPALVGGVAVTIGVVAFATSGTSTTNAANAPPAATSTTQAATTTAAGASSATTNATTPPSAVVEAPSASVTAAVPPTTTKPKTIATTVAPKKPTLAKCNPPYVIDAKGAKRYKPECL